jgi:DNA polymerase-3 subunit alpha
VNKKTLESLAYAGAFDGFREMHRAQYFYIPPAETTTGLEKIIKFGNVYQTNASGSLNTLFGDFEMPDVVPPKIPACEPWTLTELLEHEKDVTGMFMSGHPLDHFKFEIEHYGITRLGEFNEIKEAIGLQANPGKAFKLAGLVVEAQHRVTKTGRQFGSFFIEDYTGKTEFMLWSDDYIRYSQFLEKGKNLYLTGSFRQRFNKSEFEFKIDKITLLENIKQQLTKQLVLEMEARQVNNELLTFVLENVKKHPGRSGLKFNISEPRMNAKVSLFTRENGFEMNDEMAAWLLENTDIGVQVLTT